MLKTTTCTNGLFRVSTARHKLRLLYLHPSVCTSLSISHQIDIILPSLLINVFHIHSTYAFILFSLTVHFSHFTQCFSTYYLCKVSQALSTTIMSILVVVRCMRLIYVEWKPEMPTPIWTIFGTSVMWVFCKECLDISCTLTELDVLELRMSNDFLILVVVFSEESLISCRTLCY